MISKINLKCYIINSLSQMRKSKMATILLYETYTFSYLHPQMNSVWTKYVHCVPHHQDASFTGMCLFSRVSWIRKKDVNRKDIGTNFMLTPFFHRYPQMTFRVYRARYIGAMIYSKYCVLNMTACDVCSSGS